MTDYQWETHNYYLLVWNVQNKGSGYNKLFNVAFRYGATQQCLRDLLHQYENSGRDKAVTLIKTTGKVHILLIV